jgi:hypothetical protein
MLKQSDVQGRLRLFRYGIVVVTVVAFLASYLSPVVLTAPLGDAGLDYVEALTPALIVTVITAVIGAVAYFAYAQVLKRTGSGDSSAS